MPASYGDSAKDAIGISVIHAMSPRFIRSYCMREVTADVCLFYLVMGHVGNGHAEQ